MHRRIYINSPIFHTFAKTIGTFMIKIITILGLIAILFIQSIWLFTSIQNVKQSIIKESNSILQNSIDKEVLIRIDSIQPTEAIVMSQNFTSNDKINIQTEYLQEAALKYNSDISLSKLESILSELLAQYEMPSVICINKILKNDSIIDYIGNKEISFWDIKTNKIPIRLDKSVAIQAILTNPAESVFKRMGILIIATIILMLFVIGCIVYQIKIITTVP